MNVGVTSYYVLPPMYDAEGHSISVANTFGAASTFSYYNTITKTYSFTQLDNTVTGTFTIKVTLSDGGTFSPSLYPQTFDVKIN